MATNIPFNRNAPVDHYQYLEYVILVFDAYKHTSKERLTWSTTGKGKCIALLICDMGLICPFNANHYNIHLRTACREWTPTDTHGNWIHYFHKNLARHIDLRFVTVITVEKAKPRPTKRSRRYNPHGL